MVRRHSGEGLISDGPTRKVATWTAPRWAVGIMGARRTFSSEIAMRSGGLRRSVMGLALAAVHAAPGVSDAEASDMTRRGHHAADDEHATVEPDQLFVKANTKPFGIKVVNGSTFTKRVLKKKGGGLFTAVLFYVPWSKQCRQLAPAWRRAALALEGEVRMVVVNPEAKVGDAKDQGLQRKYNIQARR